MVCRSGKATSKSVRPLLEALVITKAAMSDARDEGRDGLQVLVQEFGKFVTIVLFYETGVLFFVQIILIYHPAKRTSTKGKHLEKKNTRAQVLDTYCSSNSKCNLPVAQIALTSRLTNFFAYRGRKVGI